MPLKGTLSGSYAAPVTLTGAVYTNPVTVTVTGTISLASPGIDLQAASDWTIFNQGLIGATGTIGTGVQLTSGGSIDNAVGASIAGGQGAIYIANAAGSVSNAGDITGNNGSGIAMQAGGSVGNAATGTITGTTAGIDISAGGSVTNFGSIATTGGNTSGGVLLRNGGQVSNAGTGDISANGFGIYIVGASGTVSNTGTIAGAGESGVGFSVSSGATLINAAGASISGHYSGAFINGGVGTVVDYGFIGSTFGSAIDLALGGQVSIGSAAVVTGLDSGVVLSGSGTVNNAGQIAASNNNGVFLGIGGAITNTASGVITGYTGVYITNATASVYNAGSIASTGNFAVRLNAGGTITNAAGGTISTGEFGAVIYGAAGTVVNAGSIGGGAGRDAVLFGPGFDHRMVVDPGAEFGGNVNGGNTIGASAISTLELAPGTSAGVAGTLSGLGTAFVNFAAIAIDAGAIWNLAGSNSIAAGITVTNQGQLNAFGSFTNAGTITAAANGVFLAAGNTISNLAGGLISGGAATLDAGIELDSGGSVVNSGTVSGAYGVLLRAGGSVTNTTAAVIEGGAYRGVWITGAAGTVSNAGTIESTGSAHSAIYFSDGGSIDNLAGGVITAKYHGIDVEGGAATVTNAGRITNSDPADSAVAAYDGATVVNTGLIAGAHHGIYITSGGTVTNAGTIAATGANTIAVLMLPGSANQVIVDPGAVFGGVVDGGNTVGSSIVSTLELATGSGTLAGIGSNFENFGSIVFDPSASWNIGGSTAGLAGGEIISGFTVGDTIDIVGVSDTIDSFNNGTLSLGGSAPLDLLLPGSFSDAFLANPSDDGTAITLACFLEGTRILTASGEIEVERLQPGTRVFSALHRKLLPITWIGHRKIRNAHPVRVSAGAFAAGQPHRDLWLSPDHAVYVAPSSASAVDGVLIPVRHLINDTTITQRHRAEVVYYHIELAEHGVLLAEGLPAESYLDTGNRAAFANGGPTVMAHPDFAPSMWEAQACAPLMVHGPVVVAVRERLLARTAQLGRTTTATM